VCTALGGTDASVTGKLIREVETGESILGIETARAGGELGEGGGSGGDSAESHQLIWGNSVSSTIGTNGRDVVHPFSR